MTYLFRNQARWLLGVILGYLIIVTGLNLMVNPLRMEPAWCSIAALDSYRDIGKDLRTGKAGLIRYHHGVEVAIVGSSRFEIGVDPSQPAFKGAKTLNLALAAGLLHENIAMVRYLMMRQPNLRQVVFGLELGDLVSDTDSRKFTNFYETPLADAAATPDREIRYLVGIAALEESVSTLQRSIIRKQSSRTSLGLWVTPHDQPDLRSFLTANRDFVFEQVPDMYELRTQTVRAEKISKLRSLFTDLRRRKVEVLVVIAPQLALKQIHPFMNDAKTAPWSVDRRAIYDLCREVNAWDIPGAPSVQLWDFDTFNAQTCVALPSVAGPVRRIPHWLDMGHFDVTVGRAMVERMLCRGVPSADESLLERFGVNVLEVGIDAHLEGLRLGHTRYCREHPDDVAWVRSILPVFKAQRSGAGVVAGFTAE